MIPELDTDPESPFPPPDDAVEDPNGLLAWGGDLRPQRLLNAYQQGIFPWYGHGQPILWWSPAPRCVLIPDQVHLSRRLRRRYNQNQYQVTMDKAFAEVVACCAHPAPGREETWITGDMQYAYHHLFLLGYGHSVEVWRDSTLVGGLYGLALGRIFFAESMFSAETDTSKIALISLCKHLHTQGYELIDCQVANPHLFTMGAEEWSRSAFQDKLAQFINLAATQRGAWTGIFKPQQRW